MSSREGVSPRPRVVAHVIHSLGSGGAESLLVELADTATDAQLRIVVIGLSDAEDARTAPLLEAAGATVHQLHASRYDPRAVRTVARILRNERVDIVHTHLKHADLVGGLAARMVGIPCVCTLHVIEKDPTSLAARARLKAAVLGRRALHARVIALSAAQASWYAGLDSRDRVRLIPNGVRDVPASRSRDQVRDELGVPEGNLLALTVSLMRPEKGHDTLLEAIRQLPADLPVTFAFAGDGALLDSVRHEIESDDRLRGRVHALGFRTDVVDLLSAADLVVHPSREDALPTALISAQGAGKTVIATRVGGIPDIVSGGTGILVPADDASGLATAITTTVEDPALRLAHGAAARRHFESTFAAPVWVANLKDEYEDALSGGS